MALEADLLNRNKYLKNIYLGQKVFGDNPEDLIHLTAILNSELIEDTVKKNSRTVIILPKRYYSAYWAAILSVFKGIKEVYNDEINVEKYDIGQQLIINNTAIAEFLGLNQKGEIKVKTRDGIITERKEFTGSMKAIDTRKPTSTTKKVLEAFSELKMMQNPIDDILSIHSLGDTSFYKNQTFLISKGVASGKFFENRYVNDTPIQNLINVGVITHNSGIKPFGSGQTALFNILLTADFLSFDEYYSINRDSVIGSNLIIDGTKHIKRNTGNFIQMLQRHTIPVTIFTDYSNIEILDLLKDHEFAFWHWTGDLLKECQTPTASHRYFRALTDSIEKNKQIDLASVSCKSTLLTDIVENLNRIEPEISDDNTFFKSEFSKLYSLVLLFSRMIAFPDESTMLEVSQKLDEIKTKVDNQSIFLKPEVIEVINICIECFKDIINSPDEYLIDKINNIKNQIDESDWYRYYLLVRRPEDVISTHNFWVAQLEGKKLDNLKVISLFDLLHNKIYDKYLGPNRVLLVCGWLNKSNMNKILVQQSAFSSIRLLLYEFERQWFGFACKYWDRQINNVNTSKSLLEIFQISKNLDLSNRMFELSIKENDSDQTNNIFDFEDKINTYAVAKYSASKDSNPVEAKRINFASDYFMFATDTHGFFVIDEDSIEESRKLLVEHKLRDRVYPGERVVLNKARSDILKDKADHLMKIDGCENLRQLSFLWKKVLYECCANVGCNTKKLKDVLSENGCGITMTTLRAWLTDANRIGPRDEQNLDIIALVSGDQNFKMKLKTVKKAIRLVRGYHHKAAIVINNDFIDNIAVVFNNENHEEMFSKDYIEIEMYEYGLVVIIKVIDIDIDTVKVDPQFVNHLIPGDS